MAVTGEGRAVRRGVDWELLSLPVAVPTCLGLDAPRAQTWGTGAADPQPGQLWEEEQVAACPTYSHYSHRWPQCPSVLFLLPGSRGSQGLIESLASLI